MLDRLRSGAAAVASGVDGAMRGGVASPGLRSFLDRRGAQVVAVVLGLVGAWAVATAAEGLALTETRRIEATAMEAGSQPARSRVSASGLLYNAWIETFRDDDGDGVQDSSEPVQWGYFLLDEERAGLVVLSSRGPQAVFRRALAGTAYSDPDYVAEVLASIEENWGPEAALDIDPELVIDLTDPGVASPAPLSPDRPPPDGTSITYTAIVAGPWIALCAPDVPVGTLCDEPDEIAGYDTIVYDPRTFSGVVVFMTESPELVATTFEGVLRESPQTVTRVLAESPDVDWAVEFRLAEAYVLDDGVPPEASRPVALLFGLGGLALFACLVLVVGSLSRPFVWRPSPRGPSSGLAAGSVVEANLSGRAWSPSGLDRFRERRIRLVAGEDRVGVADPGFEAFDLAPTSADGVTAGTAVLFSGRRPGVRLERPDGTLFLTVVDGRERDALAASLARMAGLAPIAATSARPPWLAPSGTGADAAADPAGDPAAWPASPTSSPWAIAASGRGGVAAPEPTRPSAADAPSAAPSSAPTLTPAPGGPAMQTSDLTEVRRRLDAAGQPFIEFMRSPGLSVGLIVLPAGGIDARRPYGEDVVYHVTAGRARVVMGEIVQVVGPGSVVHVRAGTEHRFAAIETELTALVVLAQGGIPDARVGD